MNNTLAVNPLDGRGLAAPPAMFIKTFPATTNPTFLLPLIGRTGWAEYVKTKDPLQSLLGNAPLLIDKEKEKLIPLGTAYPVEHYISQYVKNGKIE